MQLALGLWIGLSCFITFMVGYVVAMLRQARFMEEGWRILKRKNSLHLIELKDVYEAFGKVER